MRACSDMLMLSTIRRRRHRQPYCRHHGIGSTSLPRNCNNTKVVISPSYDLMAKWLKLQINNDDQQKTTPTTTTITAAIAVNSLFISAQQQELYLQQQKQQQQQQQRHQHQLQHRQQSMVNRLALNHFMNLEHIGTTFKAPQLNMNNMLYEHADILLQ
ncbi:hypothetical protein FF38_13079 [Lucilia cuprina]|uniref:Uncharacterized protein n=1 Tax=Lucilia cuprina TaxID=7375 RepID=A0A0L0CK12_LUCCU|nr:hypothetical protein FF38_13079 [Lucilia cuprina]